MNKKFEDVIAEQGRLVYTAQGDSMFPLIKPRDLLVIEPVKRPLHVDDVPLYKRDSGQYVLHRIVDVKKGKYVTKGDNRTSLEKGISDRQVIGVLTAIIRGGKEYPVERTDDYVLRNAVDLVYLLGCAAGGGAADISRVREMDLAEIYRLSKSHQVTACAATALETAVALPRLFDQEKKKAIRRHALYEIERAAITREFEKAEIKYLPLKGIPIQECYPDPVMREMIDNDILVDRTRMGDVRTIMEGLGFTCEEFGKHNHDVYVKPPVLQFEIHSGLFDREHMPVFADYFADMLDRSLPDGNEYARRSTCEDLYIYVLCHTYKHYVHAGAGLRTLLDVYLLLRFFPELDRDYTRSRLSKLGVLEFEEKMRLLSNKLFTGDRLSERDISDLKYFAFSGRSGIRENAEYNKMAENLGGDDSGSSKFRYLLSRVFISGKSLEKNYPLVSKHKALYPLLLVYRPIKGVITRPRGILREYKNVRRFRNKED